MKVAPDGGFGWVVMVAHGLSNFIIIPLMHSFGLIFKDSFAELKLTGLEMSLIVNLNIAFGKLTGLMNGILLKAFGYRKIAMLGAFLVTSGVVATSYSTSFIEYVINYGVIMSLGMGFTSSAFTLALNTYFKERKSKAIGWAVTIAGIGGIVVPQLVTPLLYLYAPSGATLIMGGFCAHLFVVSALLQPVRLHYRDVQEKNAEEAEALKQSPEVLLPVEKQSCSKKMLGSIVQAFDLDLVKDPVFLNILLGLGLSQFADLNFTILTPFILNEFQLSTGQIATFMSTLGIVDIVFRFFAPYIGEFLRKTPRPMYIFALVLVIFVRFTILLATSSYAMLLVVAAALGFVKGVRKVFRALVIPTYVPLEKLAIASGMEMMVNGTCIMIGGVLVGLVKDRSESYATCVITINAITFVTVALWTIEGAVVRYRRKRALRAQRQDPELPRTLES